MKQQIINEISNKLTELKLPLVFGNGADITVNAEFLDAGWSTGSKKIDYENSIFLDEEKQTIFMYEKTSEKGQGFSFGGDSESFSQSGTTLFRKVKSIQYGLDGKAYEFTLDLGAIPKSVKETAKKYGWKFKTVISRKKASYPEGYVPVIQKPVQDSPIDKQVSADNPSQNNAKFCANCGAVLDEGASFCRNCGNRINAVAQPKKPEQADDKQIHVDNKPEQVDDKPKQIDDKPIQTAPPYGGVPSQTETKTKHKKLFGVLSPGFIILILITILCFALVKVSVIGWIIGAVILIAVFFILRKLESKGLILRIIVYVVSLIILFLVMAFTMPDDGDKKAKSDETNSNNSTTQQSAEKTAKHSDSAFAIDYLSIDSGPQINYDSSASYSTGALSVETRFIVSFNTNLDYYSSHDDTQDETDIVGATLTVTPVSVPVGNFASFFFKQYDSITLNPDTIAAQALPQNYAVPVYQSYDEATAAEESGQGNYILYIVKGTQSDQLRFGTAILNILPSQDFSTKTYDQYMPEMIAAAAAKGYTTDTLRHRVKVSLLLESVNGKKHLIEFERDVLPKGYDILTTAPGGAQYKEDYQYDEKNRPDDLYSKLV